MGAFRIARGMVRVVMRASLVACLLQVNPAAGGENSGYAAWAVFVAILAAVAAIVSATLSARAAARSRAYSERSLAHSQEAHARLLKLERHELDNRREPPEEERAEAELDRFDVNLKKFLECMAKHDGKGTVATSIDCGLATLFENDEEIRRVDEAYRRSHERSPSVFGKLAGEFDGRDAKKILDQWLAMSQKEKFAVGGLTVWIKAQPKKPK